MENTVASPSRSECPIALALDVFGDRWSLLILRDSLFFGACTYKGFLSSPEGISTNILANRLSRLEKQGLMTRTPSLLNRKRVVYRPTQAALDLIPVLVELVLWGHEYQVGSNPPEEFYRRMREEKAVLIQELQWSWSREFPGSFLSAAV